MQGARLEKSETERVYQYKKEFQFKILKVMELLGYTLCVEGKSLVLSLKNRHELVLREGVLTYRLYDITNRYRILEELKDLGLIFNLTYTNDFKSILILDTHCIKLGDDLL